MIEMSNRLFNLLEDLEEQIHDTKSKMIDEDDSREKAANSKNIEEYIKSLEALKVALPKLLDSINHEWHKYR